MKTIVCLGSVNLLSGFHGKKTDASDLKTQRIQIKDKPKRPVNKIRAIITNFLVH